ncbi:MAG: CysZ protein [Flavobacteriales bacterium]|jgi:CysZ protein
MFKEVRVAISAYSEAWSFVKQHKLWVYLLVPGLLNVLLIVGLILSAIYLGDWASITLLDLFTFEKDTWLASTMSFAFAFFIRFILIYIYVLIYKNLILIIVSPLLALLSEKVESIKTGKTYPFNLKQFLRDVLRGVWIATRNLFRELFLVLLFSLFTGFLSPFFIFLIESYYYGFSMLDYSNERKKMSVRESIDYIHRHRGLALGNGIVFYGLFLIPFIGWMVAPALGLIAATLTVLKSD